MDQEQNSRVGIKNKNPNPSRTAGDPIPGPIQKLNQLVLAVLGIFFVGIGILGIILPLLPATVFFLLAAACFSRSSQKLYHWLHHNRWFGNYLRNYRQGNGLPIRTKITILILFWATIGYSGIWITKSLLVRIILAIITIGVTVYIVLLPTLIQPDSGIDLQSEQSD